jgi:regulator of protease activity HflC (stomatin/prohibitin superfamily)
MQRIIAFLRATGRVLRPLALAIRDRARALAPHLRRFAVSALSALVGLALGTAALVSRSGGPRAVAKRFLSAPIVRVPLLTVAASALFLGVLLASITRIPPGKIGVRQVDWGPGSGIVARDYPSGFSFALSARSSWHLVDSTTSFLRFAWKNEGGTFLPLEVRTKEGNTAQVSVTVPYRVRRGEAHRIVSDGIKDTYPSQTKSVIESVLLQELATYRSEDLYATDVRTTLSQHALERMNTELAALHVEALDARVTGVWFPPTSEKKLQEWQLGSQDVRTKAAQKLLDQTAWQAKLLEEDIVRAENELKAEAAAELEAARLANDAELAGIEREAAEYDERRRAEADAQYARRTADGALALARADAEREKLANEALDSKGGRLMLACSAASNLRFQSVTLDSSDPRVPSILDLDELVALLVGR